MISKSGNKKIHTRITRNPKRKYPKTKIRLKSKKGDLTLCKFFAPHISPPSLLTEQKCDTQIAKGSPPPKKGVIYPQIRGKARGWPKSEFSL